MLRRGGRLQTPQDAAAWLDDVGLALLYPNADFVLPSLWEAVAGRVPVEWAVRDGDGTFVSFTPEMDAVWRWKDELPARKLACVGLHVARTSSLVAPRLVAPLYALTGRAGTPEDFRGAGIAGLEVEVADAVLELGRPATRRELRLLVGAEKRVVDRVVNALQRKLVLTNAGATSGESGWSSTLHDLFARRWRPSLRRLPGRAAAVLALAEAVVRAADEVSAADLAAALRLRRREAAEALEALEETGVAEQRLEAGIPLWRHAQRGEATRARIRRGRVPPRRPGGQTPLR